LPAGHAANLARLSAAINQLQDAYGHALKLNDGWRRPQDQPKNAAAKSTHLIGAAADIDDDTDASLWLWLKPRLSLLKDFGLWMEDPRWTHGAVGTWCHFQCVPPGSGRRIFVPSTAPAAAPHLWDGVYDHGLDGR
jgi:hypothetical protein